MAVLGNQDPPKSRLELIAKRTERGPNDSGSDELNVLTCPWVSEYLGARRLLVGALPRGKSLYSLILHVIWHLVRTDQGILSIQLRA